VDLWDLTKLLFRRWYAFVPMLLVSIAVVVAVSQSVKPDYSATGHLQMIPPTSSPDDTTGPKRPFNPWMGLGLPALGNAVILKVQDENVRHSLVAAGYTDNVTITIEYGTTYFSVEAIGTTPEQATGTVQWIMKLLDGEVITQQRQFGVATQDSISTLPLDAGDKVTIVTSKKKRVLIVAAGVALLLSVGATIGLDAILRRRTRRRHEMAAQLPAPNRADSDHGPDRTKAGLAALVARRRANGTAEPAAAEAAPGNRSLVGSVSGRSKTSAKGRSKMPSNASASAAGKGLRSGAGGDEPSVASGGEPQVNGAGGRQPVMVEYRQGMPAGPDDEDGRSAETRKIDQADADSTIILPLPRADWASPQDKSKAR
jgi:hypothetical protein